MDAGVADASAATRSSAAIYAEDPANGIPAAGRPLLLYREPPGPGSASTPASAKAATVSVHYDPLLAKLIVRPRRATRPSRSAIAALRAVPDPRHPHQRAVSRRAFCSSPGFQRGRSPHRASSSEHARSRSWSTSRRCPLVAAAAATRSKRRAAGTRTSNEAGPPGIRGPRQHGGGADVAGRMTLTHGATGLRRRSRGLPSTSGSTVRSSRRAREGDGIVRGSGASIARAWTAASDETRWVFFDGDVYELDVSTAASPSRGGRHHGSLTAPCRRPFGDLVAPGARVRAARRGHPRGHEDGAAGPRPGRRRGRAVHCREGELVQPGVPLMEITE